MLTHIPHVLSSWVRDFRLDGSRLLALRKKYPQNRSEAALVFKPTLFLRAARFAAMRARHAYCVAHVYSANEDEYIAAEWTFTPFVAGGMVAMGGRKETVIKNDKGIDER